jgi:hypothetical protein
MFGKPFEIARVRQVVERSGAGDDEGALIVRR